MKIIEINKRCNKLRNWSVEMPKHHIQTDTLHYRIWGPEANRLSEN